MFRNWCRLKFVAIDGFGGASGSPCLDWRRPITALTLIVHSLHNDGLALFVSTLAYWLIARSGRTPGWVLLIPMALLPTVGYLVKQSLLIWLVFFSSYLLVATRTAWRQWLVFVLGSTASIVVAIGLCYWLWGDPFIWWTFIALGSKEVSVLRSAIHLFSAGGYALIGLLGGFVLLSRRVPDESWVLWGCWLLGCFLSKGIQAVWPG